MEWLVAWVIVAVVIGFWSDSRGQGFFLGFGASLVLSPLIGVLIVGFSNQGKKPQPKQNGQPGEVALVAGEMRKCPFCAEMIRAEAIKCRFCGSEVDPVQVEPKPVDTTRVICPGCQQSESVPKPEFGKPSAYKEFDVKWNVLSGTYGFKCHRCERSFEVKKSRRT